MMRRLARWLLIRQGECGVVLFLSIVSLILGLGMALGRSSADALFFKRFGVEYLPHMMFLISLLLITVSAAYAAIVDRITPARLLRILIIGCGLYLALAWSLMRFGHNEWAYALYFIGYGVISEFLVSHFDYYAHEHFDLLQARRLMPPIHAAGRLGAIAGGLFIALASGILPSVDMAVIWIATLAAAVILIQTRHRSDTVKPRSGARGESHFLDDIMEGMQFARKSRLLRFMAAIMFIMMLVVSIQEYVSSTLLTRHYAEEQELQAFFGLFFAVSNTIVLFLQLFATNRLMQRFGLEKVYLIFPVSSILTSALLVVSGGFWSAVMARFNFLGMLPAFRIPAGNLFFNALPAYIQGRARALLIGLMLPLGMACAGLMMMLVPEEAVDARLAAVGLLLALLYFGLKVRNNHNYSEALLNLIQQQVFSGRAAQLEGQGLLPERVIEGIRKLVRDNPDEGATMAVAELLAEQAPVHAGPFILEIAHTVSPAAQDRLLWMLERLKPEHWQDYVRKYLSHEDLHLRATALAVLARANDSAAWPVAEEWLNSDCTRLRAEAAYLLAPSADKRLSALGLDTLQAMLESSTPNEQVGALRVLRHVKGHDWTPSLYKLAASPNARVRSAALGALINHGWTYSPETDQLILKLSQDPSAKVRADAVSALPALSDLDLRLSVLATLLDDPDHEVRAAAGAPPADFMIQDRVAYQSALNEYFDHFRMQSILCKSLLRTGIDGKRKLLEETALRHADTGRTKFAVQLAVASRHMTQPGQANDAGILATVLSEEVQRHADLAIEIISMLDETGTCSAIKAALASHDRRLRAQAIESIHHSDYAEILDRLQPLLEGVPDGVITQAEGIWAKRPMHKILDWCQKEGSQWLAQCASILVTQAR